METGHRRIHDRKCLVSRVKPIFALASRARYIMPYARLWAISQSLVCWFPPFHSFYAQSAPNSFLCMNCILQLFQNVMRFKLFFFLADIQRHFPFLETVRFLLLPCPEVTLIFVVPTIRGDKICRRYGHRVLKRYQETRNLTFYRDGNDVALALAKKHRRKKYWSH